MRLLKSQIENIFFYESELWILTKKLESTVNVFQRNLPRKILDIKWLNKISSKQLYERMKTDEWSKTIKERRLSWYGYLLRLPDNTPAKTALREAQRYVKKLMVGHGGGFKGCQGGHGNRPRTQKRPPNRKMGDTILGPNSFNKKNLKNDLG